MSNVKSVNIVGDAPWNVFESEKIQPRLAYVAGPTSGLTLEWDGVSREVKNSRGGYTAFYRFYLTGQDALSWKWFEALVEELKSLGGTFETIEILDIEG